MKNLIFLLFFSTFIYSEEISLEKIFKNKYTKPIPYNFSYSEKENSLYWLRKEGKEIFLEKFDLKSLKLEKIEVEEKFLPLEFYLFEGNFLILTKDGWHKTKDFKNFEKVLNYDEGVVSPKGNYIAYSKENNLYLYSLKFLKEEKITKDGKRENFYGKTDWVYCEELQLCDGFKFSKDERYLAFLSFNEEEVSTFPLINYRQLYPSIEHQFYPKAGTQNPKVSLWVYDIKKKNKKLLYEISQREYLSSYTFTPDSKYLIISTLQRNQKVLNFYKIDLKTKKIENILKEEDKFWINFYEEPYFISKDKFIYLSERENYSSPYLYNLEGKNLKKFLRKNQTEKIIYGDEEFLYFVSLSENPTEREVIKLSLIDGREEKILDKGGFKSAYQIENTPFILINYSKVYTPTICYLYNEKTKEIIEIFNSKTEDWENSEKPKVEFFKIDNLYCTLIKPHNFKEDKKYPVIVYVYGGPHSQVVLNRFGGSTFLFHSYLANKGFLVFSLDNRGSYGRGKDWEVSIYKELGKRELEDQLKGIEYLKKLSYVDGEKIGIWGWSYGGFMVLYSMTHSEVFKAGFAVAPVTDWKYYDTIYTERYLGLPEENSEGYFNSSPINFVNALKGKLYLVHGGLDDNVHFQNTSNFIDELIKENKKFQFMFYPGRDHSIRDENARIHLFSEIYDFFVKEFK